MIPPFVPTNQVIVETVKLPEPAPVVIEKPKEAEKPKEKSAAEVLSEKLSNEPSKLSEVFE